uniref:Uncharacterized protein n=2 Tax=Macaca TaxID=9539 RepID=A0A5F7ZG62_MACMU
MFLIWLSAWMLLLYRNAADFLMLILYPKTSLKLFINSSSFWVEIVGISRHRIMLSIKRDSLTFSLPIWMPFVPFSCLIALARTSSTMLNRNGKHEHRCRVPVLKGNASSFCLFSLVLAVGLSQMALVILRYVPPM